MSKIKEWKRITSKIYEHSKYRIIEDILFELPDGRQEWYSLKKEPPVACIFALTEDQQVILTRQYRPGPNQVLDELPGGRIEFGETTLEAATRELIEETGYFPKKMIRLGKVFECAYSTIDRDAFVALGCEKKMQQLLDHNEFIEVVLKPIPEFLEQLVKGACTSPEVGWMALYHLGIIAPNTKNSCFRKIIL